jgi:hypothetical protein
MRNAILNHRNQVTIWREGPFEVIHCFDMRPRGQKQGCYAYLIFRTGDWHVINLLAMVHTKAEAQRELNRLLREEQAIEEEAAA